MMYSFKDDEDYSALNIYPLVNMHKSYEGPIMEAFLKDLVAQKYLKDGLYDLVFADLLYMSSSMFKDFMNLPTILYSNGGYVSDNMVYYPSLPSFVCPVDRDTCWGDQFDFWGRTKNLWMEFNINYRVLPQWEQ